MTGPHPNARLEGTPEKLYLVVDDHHWRVHDADFRNFKPVPRPLGAPEAQDRWFVSEGGVRRVSRFKKQDDHSLRLETLVRQLSSAGWAARERFDAGKVKPT